MTGFAILQTSASVLQKSAEMAEKDPHGAIITLVSVSVVFCALIILYFAYTFIGNLSSGKISLPKRKPAESKENFRCHVAVLDFDPAAADEAVLLRGFR